jgi:hypothetical protein
VLSMAVDSKFRQRWYWGDSDTSTSPVDRIFALVDAVLQRESR